MVETPKLARGTVERTIECEMAIVSEFQSLTSEAEQAGWSGDEIAMALMILAKGYSNTTRRAGALFSRTQEFGVSLSRAF